MIPTPYDEYRSKKKRIYDGKTWLLEGTDEYAQFLENSQDIDWTIYDSGYSNWEG